MSEDTTQEAHGPDTPPGVWEEMQRLRNSVRLCTLTACATCGMGHAAGSLHGGRCAACWGREAERLEVRLSFCNRAFRQAWMTLRAIAKKGVTVDRSAEEVAKAAMENIRRLRKECDCALAGSGADGGEGVGS